VKGKRVARALQQRIDEYLLRLRQMNARQDEKTTHRFRIASRNLLAVYPLFPDEAKALRWKGKVKKGLRRLNRLRDLHALQSRVTGHDAMLMMEIMGERQAYEPAGRHADLERLLNDSGKMAEHFIAHHTEAFSRRLRDEWFKVHARLGECLLAADGNRPKTLHSLRVAYKSFRYLLTFLHDIGELPELDEAQLKSWQDLLGKIQDSEVASAWMAEHQLQDTPVARAIEEESVRLRHYFMHERPHFRNFIDSLVW